MSQVCSCIAKTVRPIAPIGLSRLTRSMPVRQVSYKVDNARVWSGTGLTSKPHIETSTVTRKIAIAYRSAFLGPAAAFRAFREALEQVSSPIRMAAQQKARQKAMPTSSNASAQNVDELELTGLPPPNCRKNDNYHYIAISAEDEGRMLDPETSPAKSLNRKSRSAVQAWVWFGRTIPGWAPENIEEMAREGLTRDCWC